MSGLVSRWHSGVSAEAHWVGLDDRDLAAAGGGEWADSRGGGYGTGGDLWMPGAPRQDKYCVVSAGRTDGRSVAGGDALLYHIFYVKIFFFF